MRNHCLLVVCSSLIAGLTASSASAQADCDRFLWGCRGYSAPSQQAYRPPELPQSRGFFPFAPPPRYAPENYGPEASRGYEEPEPPRAPTRPAETATTTNLGARYAALQNEPFPVAAIRSSDVDPAYLRTTVYYPTNEQPGTIIIDPRNHYLYLVQENGRAIRYGVGVGREGFGWSGVATIHNKQEWPDWYPPKEMIARQPEIRRAVSELQSGLGVPGGTRNPLGARALYLWQGNKDTLFRIHGTLEPWTIGKSVSSGCIRMINQDVIDLYEHASIGTKVVVLGAGVS